MLSNQAEQLVREANQLRSRGTCFCSEHDDAPRHSHLAPGRAITQPPSPRYNLPAVEKNQLYYGDNLEVLRQHIKDESVDLIYLDPPFNSRQDYNVLFAEKDGTRSSSQIMAFEDTWEWNVDAERNYEEIVERGSWRNSCDHVCSVR